MELKEKTDFEEEKSFAVEDRLSSLFQPDTLLSEEYFGNHRRRVPLEPEKELVLAVLEDGVRSFQENIFAESGKKRALFDEAREWLFNDGVEHVFSFSSICSTLGLNPGYIRRGLKRWEEQTRETTKKQKQRSQTTPDRLVA